MSSQPFSKCLILFRIAYKPSKLSSEAFSSLHSKVFLTNLAFFSLQITCLVNIFEFQFMLILCTYIQIELQLWILFATSNLTRNFNWNSQFNSKCHRTCLKHIQYTHSHSSFILCKSSLRVLGFTPVGDLATCHSSPLFTKSGDTHELLVFGIRSADLDASDQKLPMTLKLKYHSVKLLSFMPLVISASSGASSKLSLSLSLSPGSSVPIGLGACVMFSFFR